MKPVYLSIFLLLPFVAQALTIYSARKEFLIKPLVQAYEKEIGKKVTYITGSAQPLLQRIMAEKEKASADILMTVDAGNLWNASQQGVLARVKSETLSSKIPAAYRSPSKDWFGLSLRARTIFYNPKLVKKEDLSTYADLANNKWKGKLCLRTSKKIYNQSLVAMMMQQRGTPKTTEIVKNWVANLGQPVFANDTKLLQAIASGDCAVGIANTYYFGRLVKKNPKINVKLFWPNQKDTGVHVNISGAGVVKYSKNKKEAVKFLEWLVSDAAQTILSQRNFEFPVTEGVALAPVVSSWGSFTADKRNLAIAGENQAKAVRLMDSAGYK